MLSTEEEDVLVQGEALKKRRTGETIPEVIAVPSVIEKHPLPGSSVGASGFRNLNEYIGSIPAANRRQELFDNYASPQETKRFRRESFDDFVQKLTDEVTLVRDFLVGYVFVLSFYL